MPTSPRNILTSLTARRLLVAAGILLLLLYPIFYFGRFAGDAEIHLSYAENAAGGQFFEFNAGEKSSGVTSPGYMFLVASMFYLAPDHFVPAIVKGIDLAFWYCLILLVYLVGKELLGSRAWAFAAALVAGLLPGSAYNATAGMENGVFAAVVMLFVYLAMRWRWFTPTDEPDVRKEVSLGLLLGLAVWLRPEGAVVALIALGFRAFYVVRGLKGLRHVARQLSIPSLSFLAATAALVSFHQVQTGDLFPSSGLARIQLSAADAYHLGPAWISPKFAGRLAAYLPLTGLWLVGNWLLLTGRWQTHANVGWLLLAVFRTFFILYSSVLGSLHLSRYVIFVMPMMARGRRCREMVLVERHRTPLHQRRDVPDGFACSPCLRNGRGLHC